MRRVKVEPEVFINGDWVVYPMEARVVAASIPDDAPVPKGSAMPWEAMRNFLCGGKPAGGPEAGTRRAIHQVLSRMRYTAGSLVLLRLRRRIRNWMLGPEFLERVGK